MLDDGWADDEGNYDLFTRAEISLGRRPSFIASKRAGTTSVSEFGPIGGYLDASSLPFTTSSTTNESLVDRLDGGMFLPKCNLHILNLLRGVGAIVTKGLEDEKPDRLDLGLDIWQNVCPLCAFQSSDYDYADMLVLDHLKGTITEPVLEDKESRDVSVFALKTITVEHPSDRVAASACAKLMLALLGQVKSMDTPPEACVETLAILSILITRFPAHLSAKVLTPPRLPFWPAPQSS
ncbi:hypothetical protein BT96DRAFT_997489 [Gymnopus androsaceus JB14]|uniref:Uncharacterized protein n=1 Tax=Gymnopus androsaceus JB14 TaxID=1447944 RepID=A0A6A4HCZ6_9AGAR|nr:hypothetical protein BT96DRAFT_997489 [Gymnopus androsaceus JB14]